MIKYTPSVLNTMHVMCDTEIKKKYNLAEKSKKIGQGDETD